MIPEKNTKNEKPAREIKFRRSQVIQRYRGKNKYKKWADIVVGITFYLFFIDPIWFCLSMSSEHPSVFQTSFLLDHFGLDYIAFYPWLFIGTILLYIFFMIATDNSGKLKWLWSIVPIGMLWWIFLMVFSSAPVHFG